MKRSWCLAAAACAALTPAACRRDNRAEQLAALDSAYQAGVISQAEYQAKRQQLTGAASPQPATPAPAPAATPTTTPAPPAAATEPKPSPVSEAVSPSKKLAAAKMPAERPAPHAAEPAPQPPLSTPAPPPRNGRPETVAEPKPAPGCEETESASGKVKGTKQRFYPAAPEAVRKAARAALAGLDFEIHKDDAGKMEASKRRRLGAIVGAGGERVILQFEHSRKGAQQGTLVTAETKKSFTGRLAQKSWTDAVLLQIGCHLRGTR